MRRALLASFVMLSACSASAPPSAAPIASATAAEPEPTEKVIAPSDAPVASVRVTESHRYFVAASYFTLPMLDAKAISPRLSAALASKFDAATREQTKYAEERANAQAADYSAMMCAVSEAPTTPCSTRAAQAAVAASKADKRKETFEKRVTELRAALDDSAGAKLVNAWLDDTLMLDLMDPHRAEEPITVNFELGESIEVAFDGTPYVDAAKSVPVSDALGVVVRLRAAISELETGDVDAAIALLEEAKAGAKEGELRDVWFLLGQAHAMRASDAKETARALDEALKAPDTGAHITKRSVGESLALAAYRASDFPRALEVALDVQVGRMDPPPPPGRFGSLGRSGTIGVLGGRFDANTSDLLHLEVGAIEHIGIDVADLSKASEKEADRIHGELALRAVYVGDLATATKIVKAYPLKDAETARAMVISALCAHGATPSPGACEGLPKAVPAAGSEGALPISDEIREGASSVDPAEQRAVAELSRLCVEPELAWFFEPGSSRGKKSNPPQRSLTVDITPTTPVTVEIVPGGHDTKGLTAVAACIEKLAPVRFAKSARRIHAILDLRLAGIRPKSRNEAALESMVDSLNASGGAESTLGRGTGGLGSSGGGAGSGGLGSRGGGAGGAGGLKMGGGTSTKPKP